MENQSEAPIRDDHSCHECKACNKVNQSVREQLNNLTSYMLSELPTDQPIYNQVSKLITSMELLEEVAIETSSADIESAHRMTFEAAYNLGGDYLYKEGKTEITDEMHRQYRGVVNYVAEQNIDFLAGQLKSFLYGKQQQQETREAVH